MTVVGDKGDTTMTDSVYMVREDVADDYPVVSGVLLERVDSRLGASGYVYAYAPITVCGVDLRAAFWDTWAEVVPAREAA